MFEDRVKITVKSGDGGNGKVSFHTEKYVRQGAADGGDGGSGGDIVLVASKDVTTLVEYRYRKKFVAENGSGGGSNTATGKSGKSIILRVPCGTVVKDAKTEGVLADLFYDGDKVVVLKGGVGGKGNARFKSSIRQSPTFAQTGEKTKEVQLLLELKTIADVGLVGFPNVGKSTLLSVMTSARPKIANYHFTTLSPNLGVASLYDKQFVIADIPGLIEGASEGAGLGHYFLRHIERTRLFLVVIDISGSEGRDPYNDYKVINNELKKYDADLLKRPQIVVLNKMDMPDSEKNKKTFMSKIKRLKKSPIVIEVSAATHYNIDNLIKITAEEVFKLPIPEPMKFEKFEYQKADPTAYEIKRDVDGAFLVVGGFVDELVRNVVLSDPQSFAYFQKILKDKGIIRQLKRMGMKEKDTVRISDFEFEYFED